MHLMISVVSAAEAEKAISCGATLLDIKNPEEGSLGAPFPHVIRRIKDMASDRIRISAAIGDMPNLPGTAALAALGGAACGADYVKAGLRGQSSMQEALALICAVRDALAGRNTDVVAAAYADFRRIGTLDPNAVLDAAAEAGIQGFLVDTALKDGNTWVR